MKFFDVKLVARAMLGAAWRRTKCAFGGHGPGTYELRKARWPAWCEVQTLCADCGKVLERQSIDSDLRR